MITVIPRRYDSPKWQANVPIGHAFVFSNNVRSKNLFEIKQALSSLPESVLKYHVSESRHDIADWIATSVNDLELAQEIRPQLHRWGMIVTLERTMMRTLNLPPYVAKRWLSDTQEPLQLMGGPPIASLQHLAEKLNQLSDQDLIPHLAKVPNDLAKWVNDSIGDYQLAEVLSECSNRLQMIQTIEDHLLMLKEACA